MRACRRVRECCACSGVLGSDGVDSRHEASLSLPGFCTDGELVKLRASRMAGLMSSERGTKFFHRGVPVVLGVKHGYLAILSDRLVWIHADRDAGVDREPSDF